MQSKDVMAMQQQMSQMAEMIRLQKEQVRVCEERNATTLGRMDTAYFFLCGSLPSPRC